MNLMIVEDELRLRNALAHNIPWEEHDIEVVGLASNGAEALRLVERKKPDIMLVDVQMPEMDGLTLVRKLRELQDASSSIKIIILSGHDNFTFAQAALEHGVYKYLLKPAVEEDILQAVLEAGQQLRRELEQWQTQASLQQKWRDHLPHMQNAFFRQWIDGKYDSWEVLRKSKDFYIDLDEGDRIAVAVLDIDPIPEGDCRYSPDDMPLLQFSLQCIAKELLSHPSCWVCSDAKSYTLLVFVHASGDDPNEIMLGINTVVEKLLSQTKELLKITASAGICEGTGGIGDMSLLYEQACRALGSRILYGHDIAIPYREQRSKLQGGMQTQPNLEKTLEIALETADEPKALEALEGLWEARFHQAESLDEIHEAVLYMNSLFVRMIQKQGWMVKQVVEGDIEYFHNALLLSTKEQMRAWLIRTIKNIIAYLQKQRSTTSNQVVKSILAIVDQEIDKDILLHTVADRMYVNSSYLSRLFKQETGMAFSAYVTARKMERAKAVLQEGGKVYDAARLVGYRDVSYFTKVFRKYWGVNPGEVKA